ncbi:MAG: hypothetical protein QGD90_01915 [Candidatus Hydrogenedentes bacterium]|nr:hypothetical protein [Candidatus Hydrogenedentota bacterium]
MNPLKPCYAVATPHEDIRSGNLEGGEEFESLILNLWLRSSDTAALDAAFDDLGESLLEAQEEYLSAKELDEALFGDDYE